jgi:hypothetical protein
MDRVKLWGMINLYEFGTASLQEDEKKVSIWLQFTIPCGIPRFCNRTVTLGDAEPAAFAECDASATPTSAQGWFVDLYFAPAYTSPSFSGPCPTSLPRV